jgi:hypothetical protein
MIHVHVAVVRNIKSAVSNEDNAVVKGILGLIGIFFVFSKHVECVVLMSRKSSLEPCKKGKKLRDEEFSI